MFNEKNITTIAIIILGLSVTYLAVKNKAIKESTSEEKMSIFAVCVELALDNIELENKIKEIEKTR